MPSSIKRQRIRRFTIVTLCLTLVSTVAIVYYKLEQRPDYTAKDLAWGGETAEGPRSVTSEQAKADINLLLYALDHAYGGKDFIKPQILAKAKKQLQSIRNNKPVSTHTLWYKIHEALLEIPDSHLGVGLSKNLVKSLPNDLKDKFIASRQAMFKTRGVGNNKNTTQLPWFIQKISYQSKNIALIAITRFPHPESNAWKGFLTEVHTVLKGADAIILDLRDNTGGHSSIADKLAKAIYNSSSVPDPVDCIYFKNTPETYTIHANFIKAAIQKGLSQADNIAPLQKEYDDLLKKAEEAKEKNSPKYDIRKRPLVTLSNIIEKPIAILINKRCGSSGEIMVDLLEAHPHAIRIGENTAGCIHFGNVGFFLLPHSKLRIHMPCQYRAYRDKRFIERKGIAPHIQVPSGKDAFDIALTLLKQKLHTHQTKNY